MTAPSIREALVLAKYWMQKFSGGYNGAGYGNTEYHNAIAKIDAALAAPPQDVVEGIAPREMIARALYKSRGLFDDTTVDLHFKWFARQDQDADGLRLSIIHCYRDADAILASGLVTTAHPDEAAIRADERERCAKVVDVQLQWDDRDMIAAAIRAGGAKGWKRAFLRTSSLAPSER